MQSSRLLVPLLLALCLPTTIISQTPAPWPTSGWRTASPESQGLDSDLLAEAINTARKSGLNIHSLLLVRNNYIVAEAYFYPYDGKAPPRLLEYNADTPTALLEASVAQWFWLQDCFPTADQFNSIHERLIDALMKYGMRRNS